MSDAKTQAAVLKADIEKKIRELGKFAVRDYHKSIFTLGDLAMHFFVLGIFSIIPIANTVIAVVATVVCTVTLPIWSKRI